MPSSRARSTCSPTSGGCRSGWPSRAIRSWPCWHWDETGRRGATHRSSATWPAARTRLAIVLAVNLAGLGLAWLAVEVLKSLSVTLFQPFRMATVFRGLALIAVSGRVVGLWRDGRFVDRARALLVAVGLAGDWMLVVATAVDLAVSGIENVRAGSE